MADLKHVGRLTANKKRVLVVFRTLPGDPNSALVLPTDSLSQIEHDSVMKVVESNAGQTAYELADVLNRSSLPETTDNMLVSFHRRGLLQKVATSGVELMPNPRSAVLLNEVNEAIAQQRGVSVSDLTVAPPTTVENKVPVDDVNLDTPPPTTTSTEVEQPLTDEDLAKQYRSQADAMFKEAQRLRKEADALSPSKKKAKVVKETT